MAHVRFSVADRSYLALVKKDIHRMVVEAGFPAKKVDEIDIVVAEITSNLIKHGKEGELLVLMATDNGTDYLELIAIDKGPGMAEPQRMIEDGVSTTGTLGQGLGAIKRLADVFELYSLKQWGTILLARVNKEAPGYKRPPKAVFRAVVVAKPGEKDSGDGWAVQQQDHLYKVMLGDGLGHGTEAHKAVQTATDVFTASPELSPVSLLRELHTGVKRTRGLVACVAVYDSRSKQGAMCGVGNIACKSFGPSLSKNHISYNGIVGLNMPTTLKDQPFSTTEGIQYVIMCSDGIRSQWEVTRYPGILKYDPSVLAAAIYKDFCRQTDDMSVLVGKLN